MKNSRILGFIAIVIILSMGVLLFSDFSAEYLGTAYKRLLVLRNDTATTGLHATTPERVYDGGYTASPFSLSQEEMLFDTNLQLQFRDGNMFIHSDGATSLTIDGNADLKLTGTAITMTGIISCGNLITTGGGSSAIDDIPIGAGTPDTGAFTTLSASSTLVVSGNSTIAALKATGAVDIDGGAFVFNDAGADLDARFEGDTAVNLLFLDSGLDQIGMNTATPSATLDIVGTLEVSSTSAFTGAITATGGVVGALTGNVTGNVTSSGTSAFATVTVSATTTLSGNAIFSSADIQMNSGNGIYFDADDNTGIKSDTDDEFIFLLGGSNKLTLTAITLSPTSDGGMDLGVAGTHEWRNVLSQDVTVSDDLTVGDAANITGILTASGVLNVTGAATFNTAQADIDFTVKSDDNAIALVVDASEDNVEFGAGISFNAVQAFADVDETPSVAGYTFFNSGSAAETITDFDDGNAQKYIIIFSKAAITFDVTGTSLVGGTTDIVTADGDITHWMLNGTDWYLQTFIDQSQDINTW